MRTRDTFRQAVEQLAAFKPHFVDTPAFGGPPERPSPPGGAALTPRPPLPILGEGQHAAAAAQAPQPAPSIPLASGQVGSGRAEGEVRAGAPATGGLTVQAALAALAGGTMSATALVAAAYDAIEQRAVELNVFTHLRPRGDALREAALLDEERGAGRTRGPLHGIPITVKDVIEVAGMPTTASSRVMDGDLAVTDAGGVARLRAAGAIVLGKTHTHEFALGVTMPQGRNPWDARRLAGGSSGGSAAAVASGMGLASLGTDTRASIRVPAALCGVVGFKPTFGLAPTDGVVTLSWTMDHIAPMTKDMADAALLLEVLTGSARYQGALGGAVAGMRVGVPVHGLHGAGAGVIDAFETAMEVLGGLGVGVTLIEEPDAEDFTLANAAGLIVSRVEAAAYHYPWRDRRDRYTDDVGDQLDEARGVSGVDYVQALRYRRDFGARMTRLLTWFDALALPTSKVPAPFPEESERLLLVLSENCVPWSFLGFPAVSLPCGASSGLPVGLELVAAPYADETLIALGSAYERAAAVSYV